MRVRVPPPLQLNIAGPYYIIDGLRETGRTTTKDFKTMLINSAKRYNLRRTENGALGFASTGEPVLDLNFCVASFRSMADGEVLEMFDRAFLTEPELTLLWLFYAADVRGGLGERRLFRLCLTEVARLRPELAKKFVHLVPHYTRWDNVLCLLDTELKVDVLELIKKQIEADLADMKSGKKISLCAKWLPSINATSPVARKTARVICDYMGMTARAYRKTMRALRDYLDVIEVKMSARRWSAIDYSAVPSRANILYRSAFLRNDEHRRTVFLKKLALGRTKINADVAFPHDVVHAYRSAVKKDETLEQLWKALPDFVCGAGGVIVVADGSGSMTCPVGKGALTALEVANSLAIYFAERQSGAFKNTYITFSEHPQIVDFSKCKSLLEKIKLALAYDEVANTNIEAVFDLILTTAVDNRVKQSDIPSTVLIISDMEFDYCVRDGNDDTPDATLFDTVKLRYKEHGYKLPRLVFWNVNSRTLTVPMTENDNGVTLVSGFSPVVCNTVLSPELNPMTALVKQLTSPRYQPIIDILEISE